MHLDHKIPWNTVSSHFAFIKGNPCIRERDFIIHDRLADRQSPEFNHFTRTLISTIEEFSTTERAKYPRPDALPTSGPLYDSSILPTIEETYHLGPHETNSAVSNPLCEEFQDVNYWINEAPPTAPPLRWGHSFGVTHVADVALEIYMLLNISASVKANAKPGSVNGTGCLTDTEPFERFIGWGLADFDYPAQNIPHRLFWNAKGIPSSFGIPSWDPLGLGSDEERREMNDYLKMCFELLYRYDLLMREMGRDPEWKGRILGMLRQWGATSVTMDETGFCFI
ncbi:hypothetical protein N7534_000374 [Penicillium rubens]|nr:hypothetical protein N7534_000374 [Penicillium rubens]